MIDPGKFLIMLVAGNRHLTLNGWWRPSADGFIISGDDQIKGYWDTPSAKTSLQERQTGNGAHDIVGADVLYSARTVTIPFLIKPTHQTSVEQARSKLNALAGRLVTCTVQEPEQATYVTGYLEIEYSGRERDFDQGSITLTCPRPERLSVLAHEATTWPTSTGNIGLQYSGGKKGLVYPISYGKQATDDRSVATITNSGSSYAYPVLTVHGDFNEGVRLDWHDSDGRSGSLWWNGHVGQVPLTLDCRSRTASMGGVDQSSQLARRSFPTVPAKGSLTIALRAGGTGYVNVSAHDTWI